VNAPTKARPASPRGTARRQLSDRVAAHLRAGIMSGSLRPGTFVRLDDTAAELGVSITPVREALRTLRGEGMVRLEPNRGHVVAEFTRGDIEDIFWMQATIAAQIARSVAERVTDEQIDELERLADAVAEAVERDDPAAVVDTEFAFHRAFNRDSGRTKLSWFLFHAARYLPPQIYAEDPKWGHYAVANRRKLVAALRRRDVAEVVRLTSDQFNDGARRLTARLDELGLWQ
jgi:DNA-binding GntR family transcriptional regulator